MSPSIHFRENREFASELKFVVARSVAERIRLWARAHLHPDPNGSGESSDDYSITSIYFDTDRFDVFHRKGSFGRSKYRIRRYGESEFAFLERKLKTRGMVSKRRTIVPLADLARLGNTEDGLGWNGRWYLQRLLVRQLKPICEISYRRTARVGMTENGPIRLTVDDELRASTTNGLVFNGSAHGLRFSENQFIVELKYHANVPALFKKLAEEFVLTPQPVSKYRLAVVRLGVVEQPEPNASQTGPVGANVWLRS